jgi:hypothetical protein
MTKIVSGVQVLIMELVVANQLDLLVALSQELVHAVHMEPVLDVSMIQIVNGVKMLPLVKQLTLLVEVDLLITTPLVAHVRCTQIVHLAEKLKDANGVTTCPDSVLAIFVQELLLKVASLTVKLTEQMVVVNALLLMDVLGVLTQLHV